MRAVIMREFGPPEVLQPAGIAEVTAAPGEVVIDVEICGVTFVETQIRAGRPPRREMLPALPVILGNGVGGAVAVAGAVVDAALIGRRVVTSLNGGTGRGGGRPYPPGHRPGAGAGASRRRARRDRG
jgi:NADPH2:quinone reductase